MKLKSYMLLTLIVIFSSIYIASSQGLCPENFNIEDWDPLTYGSFRDANYTPVDIICKSKYFKRDNNGTIEIIIDWSYYHTNVSSGYRNLNSEEIKDLLYCGIVQDLMDAMNPWTGVKQFVFIEMTKCRADYYCYFKLNQTSTVLCADPSWTQQEIESKQITLNGSSYYYKVTTADCGIKCCKRIVTAEIINNERIITGMTIEDYPGSSCSGNTNLTNCKTGMPKVCTGACWSGTFIRE